ncbi:Uncharacterised protein [Mycobacteroides abscessus subsp. bolletii]|uniref:DUF6414 family protein n=1 Tax=Mycobacteroides abscessus TaxID=36809 RepID=UPI00092A5AB4|nr:hypothetical protein [Mycobacteroides abscessus]SIJ41095.1 Uncharacterised protein [Mycobacteroides abscessus subsp. bolletii]SLD51516.1 Uncharacterised protein [Mycobacteroides abscessus subsp. bolletii]SLE28618.1 Uncharacterised protein [Mycobacteroides abscessus subsp. bolletii]
MILREYLYVDLSAVRGVLAQVNPGIIETETETESTDKKTSGGIKGFTEHVQNWGTNTATSKSFADAVFPRLEKTLEVDNYLEDISGFFEEENFWKDGQAQKFLPPGKIVRLTAQGHLIDARFIAKILSGFTTTYRGFVNIGLYNTDTPTGTTKSGKRTGGGPRVNYDDLPGEADNLEDRIPLGIMRMTEDDNGGISGEYLRGITQIARGMFVPGLHMALTPEAEGGGTVMVRLQEGRQYLDTDPDILFARYGVGQQEWTVVGTIGHHPLPSHDFDGTDLMSEDGIVHRGKFGQYVNQLGTLLGNLGFTDLPQTPGFSIVPWAVYRTIGNFGRSAD